MIKLIVGPKGSGKTKTLIDMVNKAVSSESGRVVCIEKGAKLTYDISHKARLIEMDHYDIKDYDSFFGFINGIVASNYDITTIFVDSIAKIAGQDMGKCAEFIDKAEKFTAQNKLRLIITVSVDPAALPERVHKYIQ